MLIKQFLKIILGGLVAVLCINIAYAEIAYEALVKEGDVLLSVNDEKAKPHKQGDFIKLAADDLVCLKSDKGVVEISNDKKSFKEYISTASLCLSTPAEKGVNGWFSNAKKAVEAIDEESKMPLELSSSQLSTSVIELDGEEFYIIENNTWQKNRHTLPFKLQVLVDDKGEVLKQYVSKQKHKTQFFIPRKDIESAKSKGQSLRLNVMNKPGNNISGTLRFTLKKNASQNTNITLMYQLKTLALQEKQLGKVHLDIAKTCDDLSLSYQEMKDFSSALGYQQKALKIRQKLLGSEHSDTATTYLNIGRIYAKLNNPVEAENYKNKARQILDKTLGRSRNLGQTVSIEKDTHTLVDILYGTDRLKNTELKNPDNREEFFTGDRGNLRFGLAQVSIPKRHKIGAIERPGLLSLGKEKIGEHVILTKLNELNKNDFLQIFNNKLKGVKESDILIFIHGYNVSFANAIRRTAQLTYDLEFKGVPLTYSWPSQGYTSGYFMDEASIQYTVPHLVTFLKEVIDSNAKSPKKANIHIIGHSMGSRALGYALKELSFVYEGQTIFENVIFAAPDLDMDVFEVGIYPYLRKTSNKVTLYASSEDTALVSSEVLHGAQRLGQGGEQVFIFEGLDTIDASGIDPDLFSLSHSYFSEKKFLLNDLKEVIFKSLPPQNRDHLVRILRDSLVFWRFKS